MISEIISAIIAVPAFLLSFHITWWLMERDWRTKKQKELDYQRAVEKEKMIEDAIIKAISGV